MKLELINTNNHDNFCQKHASEQSANALRRFRLVAKSTHRRFELFAGQISLQKRLFLLNDF